MKKATTILSAMILFLSVGVCTGEPDSVTKYLMDDPVSMLDWGIYKFDHNVIDPIFPKNEVLSSTSYYFTSNKIIIGLYLLQNPTEKLKSAKETKDKCRDSIHFIKTILKQIPLDVYFLHQGFAKKNAPNISTEHIRGLIEVQCSGPLESGTIMGKSSLNEDAIYFSE